MRVTSASDGNVILLASVIGMGLESALRSKVVF